MYHIFISHQSDHRGFAGLLSGTLEQLGYPTWWSGKLIAGTDYQHDIWKALQEACCVIVVWSEASIASQWVRNEAEYARSKKRLVPIRIDDVDLWPPFALLHTLDFCAWEGNRSAPEWIQLLTSIKHYCIPDPNSLEAYIAKRGHLVHKFKAKDSNGRWAYYFILVEPENEAAFMRAIGGTGMIDIEDYGTVIASCYGEEPNPETRAFLKQKYDFDV